MDPFQGPVLQGRENPMKLGNSEAQPEGSEGRPLRTGLSVKLRERNKYVQAARSAKGATLTPNEVVALHREFDELWTSFDNKSVFKESYDAWRRAPQQSGHAAESQYRPSWGGGCKATPLAPAELCNYIREAGWPTYKDVFDTGQSSNFVPATDEVDWDDVKDFDAFGNESWARNVPRDTVPSMTTTQFDIIEKSIFHYLESLTSKVMSSGDVMLMAEGPLRRDLDQPVEGEGPAELGVWRSCVLITGTCFSPKVFDATLQTFVDPVAESAESLFPLLPCIVETRPRPCQVGRGFMAIPSDTSDEWIAQLIKKLRQIALFRVGYKAIKDNGTLWQSRIEGIEKLGMVWVEGMKEPLDFGLKARNAAKAEARNIARSEAQARRMSSVDPFSAEAAASSAQAAARAAKAAPKQSGRRRSSGQGPRAPSAEGGVVVPHVPPSAAAPEPELWLFDDGDAESVQSEWIPPNPFDDHFAARFDNVDDENLNLEALDEGDDLVFHDDLDALEAKYGHENGGGAARAVQQIAGVVDASVDAAAVDIGLAEAEGERPDGDAGPEEEDAPVEEEVLAWQTVTNPGGDGWWEFEGRRAAKVTHYSPGPFKTTIRCYRHTSCKLIVNVDLATDEAIKKWIAEVPRELPTHSVEERKALQALHFAYRQTVSLLALAICKNKKGIVDSGKHKIRVKILIFRSPRSCPFSSSPSSPCTPRLVSLELLTSFGSRLHPP